MKRHEAAYFSALQSSSEPMRRHWDVRWLDDEGYDFRFRGNAALYRYWDATPVVEFSLDMARQALETDLREETEFLDRFDRVYRRIDEHFDVRGNALTTLVIAALQNNGKVSKNRRKQFQFIVPNPVFDAIEQACAQVLVADTSNRDSSKTRSRPSVLNLGALRAAPNKPRIRSPNRAGT